MALWRARHKGAEILRDAHADRMDKSVNLLLRFGNGGCILMLSNFESADTIIAKV